MEADVPLYGTRLIRRGLAAPRNAIPFPERRRPAIFRRSRSNSRLPIAVVHRCSGLVSAASRWRRAALIAIIFIIYLIVINMR